MIASVCGRVAAVSPDRVVVEVGGVGLALSCTAATAGRLRVGETVRLSTSLVVREDALTLYGFADDDARELFELLQSASGVGPKLAQAVLAVLSPDAVRLAIATEDLTALTRVPGIGRKGAQRLVLELRDRVAPAAGSAAPAAGGVAEAAWRAQLREALAGLGWGPREVDAALTHVSEQAEAEPEPDLAVLLRSSLRVLSRV